MLAQTIRKGDLSKTNITTYDPCACYSVVGTCGHKSYPQYQTAIAVQHLMIAKKPRETNN